MRWTPHATVACVIEQQGRFLLVEERSNGRRVLNQPAGHLEAGETQLEGAEREALEETGWRVEVTDLLGFYSFTSGHNQTCYHRFCFVAKALEQLPEHPLDPAIIATHWLTPEQIRARSDELRSPMVLAAIDDYLAGIRHPLALLRELDADGAT